MENEAQRDLVAQIEASAEEEHVLAACETVLAKRGYAVTGPVPPNEGFAAALSQIIEALLASMRAADPDGPQFLALVTAYQCLRLAADAGSSIAASWLPRVRASLQAVEDAVMPACAVALSR